MNPPHVDKPKFRLQRLSVALLLLSVTGHAVCLWILVNSYDASFYPFFTELFVCVVFSALGSAASAFSSYREQFRFIHALKVIVVVMALRLNTGDAFFAGLIPIASLVVELALYEELRWGAVCVCIECALCAAFGMGDRPVSFKAFFVFQALTWFAAAALLTHYRNKSIETEINLRNHSNAFKKLAESNLDLQNYAVVSEKNSAEQERKKISGALHDSIGYALTNIIAASSAIELLVLTNPEQARELARSSCELSTNCLKEVRQTLRVLRTLREDQPILIKAIMKVIAVFKTTTGVAVEFNYGNIPWEFKNRALNQTLYRLVQEGMTNAFRHGKADLIRITMWKADSKLNAQIWDNGRGCGLIEEGLGIADLRERIQDLGGYIEVDSLSDGFSLLVSIPLYEQDEYEQDSRSDS